MEGTDGSPPPSLCIVRATEFFPRLNMEKEDADLEVPYQERSYYIDINFFLKFSKIKIKN